MVMLGLVQPACCGGDLASDPMHLPLRCPSVHVRGELSPYHVFHARPDSTHCEELNAKENEGGHVTLFDEFSYLIYVTIIE